MTAHRRFLVLTALRWFPVGLCTPILVLLPLDRGLTLAQVGLVASLQGFVVLGLELPTGALSDSWGRRPVLAVSAVLGLVSITLFALADTMALFAAVYVLQGIYRALDSGPLESWYVDARLAADPHAKIDRGLAAGSTATGLAIGGGALVAGALVAWVDVPGTPALALPVWLGAAVQLAGLVAILLLVREPVHPSGPRRFAASLRGVPRVVTEGVGLVRRSRILLALLAVELCWGFGMVTFEVLMNVRLAEEVGGLDPAAALAGPASAVAWLAFAGGSALVPLASARFGIAASACVLRIMQGAAVVGMGLLAGPVGVLAGFLAAYAVHGASGPVHMTLLHGEVSSEHRSTVMSMNSMVAQPAGALGMIILTAIASSTSVSTAIVVGGVVLAAAAPLYLPAARAGRPQPVTV